MSHSPSRGATGTWQDEHKRQAFCLDLLGEPCGGALGSHQARVGSQEEVFHGSRIVQLVLNLLHWQQLPENSVKLQIEARRCRACPTYLETWEFPKIRGVFLGGLNNTAYSVLGSILGSPCFGKLPLVPGCGICRGVGGFLRLNNPPNPKPQTPNPKLSQGFRVHGLIGLIGFMGSMGFRGL